MSATLPPLSSRTLSQAGGVLADGIYNFSRANYPKTRAGIAKVKAGVAPFRIGIAGDSAAQGLWAGTANGFVNSRIYSWPSRVVELLNAAGLSASAESWFGDGVMTSLTDMLSSDPRFTVVNNTAIAPSGTFGAALGGRYITLPGNSSDQINFAPSKAFRKVDIYYVRTTGTGTLRYAINGGAWSNIVTQDATIGAGGPATACIGMTTADVGSVGSHTVSLQGVSGSYRAVLGMRTYTDAAHVVELLNYAWSGARAYSWADRDINGTVASNLATPLQAVESSVLKPDAVFYMCGANDQISGKALSETLSRIRESWERWQAAGIEIFAFGYIPINPTSSTWSQAGQDAYRAGLKALCLEKGVAMADFAYADKVWANWTTRGLSGDGSHANGAGHYANAMTAARLLTAFVR